MIAIIDYGAGNLFSVKNALDYIGVKSIITKDIKVIQNADSVILPGVGAFPSAMAKLTASGLVEVLKAYERPLLGICLGMQMLFSTGYEFEPTKGLGLISGSVEKIIVSSDEYKIPHIGFNQLIFTQDDKILDGVVDYSNVYFVHSYMANTDPKNVLCYCDYSAKIPALVKCNNVYGAQFHPEKSGEVGLTMLKNFASF